MIDNIVENYWYVSSWLSGSYSNTSYFDIAYWWARAMFCIYNLKLSLIAIEYIFKVTTACLHVQRYCSHVLSFDNPLLRLYVQLSQNVNSHHTHGKKWCTVSSKNNRLSVAFSRVRLLNLWRRFLVRWWELEKLRGLLVVVTRRCWDTSMLLVEMSKGGETLIMANGGRACYERKGGRRGHCG